VAAAIAGSLAGAALMERFAWNQEAVEGIFLLLAAVLLVTMIVWMRRVARSLRGAIEQRVGLLAGRARFAAAGLFLFVFVLVLREGIETVLLLGAVSLNAQGAAVAAGTALGLVLAVGFAWFFFRGALPIRLDRFFSATSFMLMIVAAQLTLTGLHELSEAMVIPTGPRLMAVLGPIVRNEIFFFVLLLATAVLLVGRELLERHAAARERRWMAAATVAAFLVLLALTAEHVYAGNGAGAFTVRGVSATGDAVRLPVAEVSDGELHRYHFAADGVSVSFLVLRHPDGHLMAGLEACTICGAHGYTKRGDMIICGNCAAEIPVSHFQTPGGCNPVPLTARVEGDELVVPVAELLKGARFFRTR